MRLTRHLAPTLIAAVVAVTAAACGAAQEAAPTPASQPSVASLVRQARTLDLDGQPEAAVAIFRQALEREPGSFDAHYGLGRALDLAGDYADARVHFARAIELAPDNLREQALRMMGIAWTFVGDVDQAARYFREVFDARIGSGQFPGAADVANELGRVYLESGHLDDAERWYRTGHEAAARETGRPARQVALSDMRWAHAEARLAARRGRAREAKRHEAEVWRLLDASGDADEQVQYPYLLGYDAFYLKEYGATVDHLRKADQADPFILVLLAQASEKLGQRDAAEAYYRKVLASSSHAINSAFARPLARERLESRRDTGRNRVVPEEGIEPTRGVNPTRF